VARQGHAVPAEEPHGLALAHARPEPAQDAPHAVGRLAGRVLERMYIRTKGASDAIPYLMINSFLTSCRIFQICPLTLHRLHLTPLRIKTILAHPYI
jgi:hypothetical protein